MHVVLAPAHRGRDPRGVRLHVNVDHVATLRQARGTDYPDPVEAALLCEKAGADGITVHLREDRRHIQDADVERMRPLIRSFLNLEMAATDEMVAIAERVKPNLVTLVPERREERTTEGGLDVYGQRKTLGPVIRRLSDAGIPVSLFIAPEPTQIDASKDVGAAMVELHTGEYAHAALAVAAQGSEIGQLPTKRRRPHELDSLGPRASAELDDWSAAIDLPRMETAERLELLSAGASRAKETGLRVAAGHGLTLRSVVPLVTRAPEIEELNIGHALVADAVMVGLERAVRDMKDAIARGLAAREG